MEKAWLLFGAAVATVVAIVLIYVVHVPLSVVLSLGFGALCLLWLVVLLTLPWNLYFQAHTLIHEIRISRERGIEVSEEREIEARRIAKRMRWAAIGAHLISAAVLGAITFFSGAVVGYYFAGFYLLSTFFRPAGAYFTHLRSRMTTMLKEVRYPRDDVLSLTDRVTALEDKAKDSLERIVELAKQQENLQSEMRAGQAGAAARADELDRRLDALGRQFEDSLSRLTDNQEVIAGIKAFLRLIRSDLD